LEEWVLSFTLPRVWEEEGIRKPFLLTNEEEAEAHE
jgi:hypothetical protein